MFFFATVTHFLMIIRKVYLDCVNFFIKTLIGIVSLDLIKYLQNSIFNVTMSDENHFLIQRY